jgi:LmbE family N-acetylglucosaminyl deacetylase
MDISETIDLKLKAVRCHKSQGLTAQWVQERIRNRASEMGKVKGYTFGEAFKKIVM